MKIRAVGQPESPDDVQINKNIQEEPPRIHSGCQWMSLWGETSRISSIRQEPGIPALPEENLALPAC